MFRFYYNNSNMARFSRRIALSVFIVGLLLIGFGMLVFILRDLFAFLAAGIFFLAGISTIGYALRILLASTGSSRPDSSSGYRENVQIHIEEND